MRTIRILQEHVRISDPHITSDNADRLSILGNVFDPLIRIRDDGSFDPCLATAWTLSNDARTWSFTLRDDVSFHDGSVFTSDDVIFSLRRMRDEDIEGELGTSGVIQGYLSGCEIEKEGPRQVILTTPEPMADLADLLCEIPILSETSVASLPEGFVGTGKYRIEDASSRCVIMHSDDTRLIFRSEPDCKIRLQELKEGFADIAAKLAPAQSSAPGVNVLRSTTSVCATFMFNLAREEARNPHLRRAINLAVDVDALVQDVMHGAADVLTGPLTRRHLGFDPEVPAWTFDPQAARNALQEGGVPEGWKVEMDIPSVLPDEAPQLANRIAGYLADVGLDAVINIDENRPRYATRVRDGDIGEMACFDSSPASTFRVYREKFHSGFAGPWWLGYANLDFDALLDRGRSTSDLSIRQSLYRQAYRMLRDDAPWLFLYNPVRLTATSTSFADAWGDWHPSTGGHLLF